MFTNLKNSFTSRVNDKCVEKKLIAPKILRYTTLCTGKTVVEIWRFNGFFKMAASAISDLSGVYWDHPRRLFGGLYPCAKFGLNRLRSTNVAENGRKRGYMLNF